MIRYLIPFLVTTLWASLAMAETGYEVTSKDGDKVVRYMVRFGGGKRFESHTGFDPISKKFIYLSWPRGEAAPKPVASYWDPTSARKVVLYQFPGTKQALPVIPSIDAMKACPLTGDTKFKHKTVMMID